MNTTPKSQNNIPRQKKQENNKMEKDKKLKKGHSRATSNTAEESKLINCSCSSDEETSKLIDLSDDDGFDAGLTVTSTQKSKKQNETKKCDKCDKCEAEGDVISCNFCFNSSCIECEDI